MGMFFRELRLEPGEVLRGRVRLANLYRGARSIGGRLAITDRAVIFEPNWLDFVTGVRGRRVGLADVVRAEVVPPKLSLSPHKVRTRVRIEVINGEPMLVAVRDADGLVQSLS
jgi:hypothetical protein